MNKILIILTVSFMYSFAVKCSKNSESKNQQSSNLIKKTKHQYFTIIEKDTIALDFYEDYLILFYKKHKLDMDCEVTDTNFYTYNIYHNRKNVGRLVKNYKDKKIEVWIDKSANRILNDISNMNLVFNCVNSENCLE